jgi:hypothetical protein
MIVIAGGDRIFSVVRPTFLLLWLAGAMLAGGEPPARIPAPPQGHVSKVLPHLLDLQGRHTVSPSLFDRDAYQAYLKQHPEAVSGIRYDVRWRAQRVPENQPILVRLELQGMFEGKFPRQRTLEQTFTGRAAWGEWTGLALTGPEYADFGKITAWRVTLWCGEELLDEYKSFLW